MTMLCKNRILFQQYYLWNRTSESECHKHIRDLHSAIVLLKIIYKKNRKCYDMVMIKNILISLFSNYCYSNLFRLIIGGNLIKVMILVIKYSLNFAMGKVYCGAKRCGSHLFALPWYLNNEASNQKKCRNKSFLL